MTRRSVARPGLLRRPYGLDAGTLLEDLTMHEPTSRSKARHRRGLLLATFTSAALVAAACGGGTAIPGTGSPATSPVGSPDSSPAVSPESSGTVGSETGSPSAGGNPAEDPCALLTEQDAGTLLGLAVTGETSDTPVGVVCRYIPGDGTSGFVVATIHTDEAGDAFDQAVTDFSLAEVADVGDTAAGVDGTLFVRSGVTVFSVIATDGRFQPIPLDDLVEVARDAVERLGGSGSPTVTPGGLESPSGLESPTASP